MAPFTHIPLGTPIPDSPHAVSCSLPTMAAVRGYEEKKPEVTAHLSTGYPRFVVHPLARRLGSVLCARHGLDGRTLWLASSRSMASDLLVHLLCVKPGCGAQAFSGQGVHGVSHPQDSETSQLAKLYLQHVGGFISSREAEDRLFALGEGPQPVREELFGGDAEREVRRHLGDVFAGVPEDHLKLAACGMNAVHSAFSAVSQVQAARGRTAWVQLGWLYLDTIAILKKFTPSPADYIYLGNVLDTEAVEALLQAQGDRIAAIVAEVPSNPLVQTPDLQALAAACRRHGVLLVLDPSISSAFSVDCLPYADVVATSLTKYTASEGDLVAGALVVNPRSSEAAAIARAARTEAPYARDLGRLAFEMAQTRTVLAAIEEACPKVARFLEGHPSVRAVHWALSEGSRENYLKIARSPSSTGGMISFSLRGEMEPFYDRLRLPKGPSFGMKTTLICPFMYLAHYDLVTSQAGRAELAKSGLDGDLLRLCVGTEGADAIIQSLAEAFAG